MLALTSDDIGRLPNSHRGVAARRLHSQLKIVGNRVVFCGLMAVWDHDHGTIAGSFGSETDFLLALRDVAPPIARTGRLQVWRGVDGVGAIDGLPPCLRTLAPLSGPRPDQFALKLGETAQNGEHQTAMRCRRVSPSISKCPTHNDFI
jgi:hypothetical protein